MRERERERETLPGLFVKSQTERARCCQDFLLKADCSLQREREREKARVRGSERESERESEMLPGLFVESRLFSAERERE